MQTLPQRKNAGFTVLEIMIVVFVIGILAAITVPYYFTARDTTARRVINNNLLKIEYAKFEYALEHQAQVGDPVDAAQLEPYLKRPLAELYHPDNGEYVINPIGSDPVYAEYADEVISLPTAASF